ncbi:MAG: alpha-E domain-containing protein, partial [Sphingomonadales bacterium]|nr:alpha-E domain-containing protein [Sphingomonadales bacterium]
LRNEGHDFLRIGGALERAEMTLRLLDVKYYVLLPETAVVGGGRDHYQWTSVLHALAAARAYHHVYGGGDYSPWRIADLLVLNQQFPRSLSFCFGQIGWHLDRLAQAHGRRGAAHDTATLMLAELRDRESGEIFEEGLHEFVQNALVITNRLSREIAQAYHFN